VSGTLEQGQHLTCLPSHLGGFPVCPVCHETKSEVDPPARSPACQLESQAWSDDVPAIAGAVESERGRQAASQPASQSPRPGLPVPAWSDDDDVLAWLA
jgi:hypothetical protein